MLLRRSPTSSIDDRASRIDYMDASTLSTPAPVPPQSLPEPAFIGIRPARLSTRHRLVRYTGASIRSCRIPI